MLRELVLGLLVGGLAGQSVMEATAFNDRLFALGELARPVREEDRLVFSAADNRKPSGGGIFGFFKNDKPIKNKAVVVPNSVSLPPVKSTNPPGIFGFFQAKEENDDLDGEKRVKKKGGLFGLFEADAIEAEEEDEDTNDEGGGFNPAVALINRIIIPAAAKRRLLGLQAADAELPLDPQILNSIPINIKRAPVDTVQTMKLYAAASSCRPERLSNWTCKENCAGLTEGTEFVKYIQDDYFKTAGYIALNHKKKYIVLSYRGSSNFMNWLMDLNTFSVPYTLSEIKNSTSAKSFNVHSGFQKMAGSLLNQTREAVIPLLTKYPKYRLAITGHSAGGAIALLTATALGGDGTVNWRRMLLVTLGMPRVGDLIFCAYMNSRPLTAARVTNPIDPVPLLPTQDMGFHHIQYEYFLSDYVKPIDPQGITTCSALGMSEDPACARFDITEKHMQGHFKYFGYFQTNC